MSQIPSVGLLRGAGWCLSLLLLAWSGGIGLASAQSQPVASSVYAGPVGVLPEFRPPDPAPTPTSSPTVTASATPTPTPTLAPTPQLVPQPTTAAAPSSPPAPSPPPAPPPPAPNASESEAAAIISLTNELRAQHGLPPLTVSAALAAAAQGYAETMAASDWFAHEGPDGSTLASRAESAGYAGWVYLAENVYRGPYGDAPASIVQVWIASPAHLSAMLSNTVTEIGVGCEVSADFRWCVQDLGAR